MSKNNILKRISNNKNFIILLLFYSFSLVSIISSLYDSINAGGQPYWAGDWLINNIYTPARRGWFGTQLFTISDFFNVNTLYLLGAIQAIIICSLFLFFLFIGYKLKKYDNVFFLLISPFFLLFWSLDIGGCFRKEIMTYFAFIPLLMSINRSIISKYILLSISVAIFLIASLAHEAQLAFVPFFVIISFIIARVFDDKFSNLADFIQRILKTKYCLISIFLYTCVIIIVLHNFTLNFSLVSPDLVCKPILEIPGIADNICDGAISAVDMDVKSCIAKVSNAYLHFIPLFNFALILFISYLIMLFTLRKFFSKIQISVIYILSFLPFIPLFYVAYDWGRLINYYVTAMTTLYIAYMLTSRNNVVKMVKFTSYKYALYLLLLSLFGLHHCGNPLLATDISYLKKFTGLTNQRINLQAKISSINDDISDYLDRKTTIIENKKFIFTLSKNKNKILVSTEDADNANIVIYVRPKVNTPKEYVRKAMRYIFDVDSYPDVVDVAKLGKLYRRHDPFQLNTTVEFEIPINSLKDVMYIGFLDRPEPGPDKLYKIKWVEE